jgi:DNA-binding response OmpR family regulator
MDADHPFADRLLTMVAMSRPRVLLADDDPRVLSVVSRYLALEGYEMSTVSDGEAAVATAAAEVPDLIILDIMMPGIDGIEACRRIRANAATSQTPVLMFSALSEEAEQARLAGADGMLPKPFNLPALAEAVKTFFASRTPTS